MSKQKNWSYSQLSGYEQCPHAHMYRKIVKLPEEPSWHLTNGNHVHKLAENFLLGKIEKLPKELAKFRTEFDSLIKAEAVPEEAFVFNKDWKHILDGWSDPKAWLRLKLDARIGNYLIDFKTGKEYPAHVHQGRLYANAMMMIHNDMDEVEVEFWYLSSGKVTSFTFYRDDLEKDIADWEQKVLVMHSDSTFKPRRHQYCRNCYVKHLCPDYGSK